MNNLIFDNNPKILAQFVEKQQADKDSFLNEKKKQKSDLDPKVFLYLPYYLKFKNQKWGLA